MVLRFFYFSYIIIEIITVSRGLIMTKEKRTTPLLGSHVGMSGKDMLLGSAREAVSYHAETFMFYSGFLPWKLSGPLPVKAAPSFFIRVPMWELAQMPGFPRSSKG